MLCFSVDSRDSLENVQSKWVSEIVDHCEGVKLVLVALKCDLRSNEDSPPEPAAVPYERPPTGSHSDDHHIIHAPSSAGSSNKALISYEEGLAVAKKVGALRYLECSAKKNRGVNEAFTEAARCALSAKPKGAHDEEEKKGCLIM